MPSSSYLLYYTVFIVLGSIERVMSTFAGGKTISIKKISKGWFFIPFYGYLLLIIFSIVEFFLYVRTVNLAFSIMGVLLYLIGVFLRRKGISDLGGNWSVYSEIRHGHTLKTDGIYKFLKHPYYLAVLLELTGACLVANAFYTLIPVFVIQAPLLIVRSFFEERMLIAHFGERYKKYMKGKPT